MRAGMAFVAGAVLSAAGAGDCQPVQREAADGRGASTPAPPKITLRPGDRAPAISADTWINGSPIPRLDPGKVYIVEFWATWCGPCVKNIPHLNEIQKQYPAVTVIGIAASEPQSKFGTPDRREANVRAFIAQRGAGMAYRNAYDSRQVVYDAWMTASGNATIPKTFLVGADGKIAWIGQPEDLEGELMKVVGKPAKSAPPAKAPATSVPPPTKPIPRLRALP